MNRTKRPARHLRRRRPVRAAVRPLRGYPAGYKAGYGEGQRVGRERYGTFFDGTSIIIPSYNQVDYLKRCLESIEEHTTAPHEIIVVDNASSDETASLLRQFGGRVRYRILEENRGFAGASNVGMMMAKGKTMLLLNNDTIVTERWLDNLLICLNSDADIAMVGPVTNYISGDQQIDVPYSDVRDMQDFAKSFNVSDSGKWQRTDRLTGFCLLLRRELWESTGFLDEGFAIGNFEDDDYNIRVRLQGYSLVIARDTFIHHYGSVSMKALGDQFEEVNDLNSHYYADKWGNPQSLVHEVLAIGRSRDSVHSGAPNEPEGEAAFYPQGVIVRGIGDKRYWIDGRFRRPVEGGEQLPATRLSQVDLWRWPIGAPVSVEEAGSTAAGLTAVGTGEACYIVENGIRRRIVSRAAAEAWRLNLRPDLKVEDSGELAVGLPIIPPTRAAPNL